MAHYIEETKGSGKGNNKNGLRLQLDNLEGIDPIHVEFNPHATVNGMMLHLNTLMKTTDIFNLSTQFTPNNQIPTSYPITVADQDVIDFETNQFKLNKYFFAS